MTSAGVRLDPGTTCPPSTLLTAPRAHPALHHCSLAPRLCVPSCSLRRHLKDLLGVGLSSRHGEQSREQRPRTLVPGSWGSLITGDRAGKRHACPTSSGWRTWGRPRAGSSQPAWSFSPAGMAPHSPGLPTPRPHSSDSFVSSPGRAEPVELPWALAPALCGWDTLGFVFWEALPRTTRLRKVKQDLIWCPF